MGTDEPRPSGRPNSSQEGLFIKILLGFEIIFKNTISIPYPYSINL